MKQLAVFNQKGGVGKTTTTLNIGAGLARRGRPVLLIDLDPQAHLTSINGEIARDVNNSMFAFYRDQTPLKELEVEWPNVGHLIPAHTELIKVDSLFGKGPNILNRLSNGLKALHEAKGERTILIDCCPFLGVLSLNAVFAADCVIVPVASDFLSLRGAQQIEHTLKVLEPVLKRRPERRYLMTRFDRRRKMCFEIQTRMRELFGNDFCETVISENVAVAEAPAMSLDIFSHAPDSRGAQDYAQLIEELAASGVLEPFSERSS
ncbi:MAG TPA: ParA family protein [Rhodocyclaceae bacterium]|jgi:chromosome partitioning protein|nr:ParA family protein [Rhodocyclaceae bacterium]